MKRIKLSIFSSLAIVASLISASCSSDVETVAEESAVETTDDGTAQEEEVTTSPLITVTINNAAKNTVTYSRSEIQTSDEKEIIGTPNFYIFMKGSDGTYYYHSSPTFEADEDDAAIYSYSVDLDLIGETIQLLLLANDTPTITLTKGETTLYTFKKSLATASVSTGDNVDVLVGGFPSSDETTGFPMSTTAYYTYTLAGTDYETEEVPITTDGVELEATLVRTMARVDVINYATNLTVTDVYIYNTPNKSFLFKQDTLAEPTTSDDSDFEYVTLKALSPYYDDLEAFTTDNEYASTDEDTDITTMEQVLYMYEQSYSDTYPIVFITYDIDNTDNSGTVGVAFKEINVNRNYLYTIRLGKDDDDDSEDPTTITFDAKVAFSISVEDWEDVTNITEELIPGDEKDE